MNSHQKPGETAVIDPAKYRADIKEYARQAATFFHAKNWQDAIKTFDLAIGLLNMIDKNNREYRHLAECYILKGRALHKTRNFQEASKLFEEAINILKTHKEEPLAFTDLASAYAEAGRAYLNLAPRDNFKKALDYRFIAISVLHELVNVKKHIAIDDLYKVYTLLSNCFTPSVITGSSTSILEFAKKCFSPKGGPFQTQENFYQILAKEKDLIKFVLQFMELVRDIFIVDEKKLLDCPFKRDCLQDKAGFEHFKEQIQRIKAEQLNLTRIIERGPFSVSVALEIKELKEKNNTLEKTTELLLSRIEKLEEKITRQENNTNIPVGKNQNTIFNEKKRKLDNRDYDSDTEVTYKNKRFKKNPN